MTRSEECRVMLRILLNGIRAHDNPKNTIIEDCGPDSARFVLKMAIEELELGIFPDELIMGEGRDYAGD